jgi:sporulation protein YhbH
MSTVFRPYSESDALRSDRSAGDRKRHREKLRKSIRENIADIIAEESIIGRDRDRIIKVPIRGVKEYRFVFGDNAGGVGTGDGSTEPGQVVGQAGQKGQKGQGGPGGSEPGVDYYETEISLDELVDIMFEDLELPDMERKMLREALSERVAKRKGYKKQGVRVHLDRKRTAKARIRRRIATGGVTTDLAPPSPPGEADADEAWPEAEEERFPFRKEDLTYRRLVEDTREESNAVVICIMDTSGSMDRLKKYLARSFFFLLFQFVCTKYENVHLVFIGHHTQAKEVTEDEFFHKGESGGTLISSGYKKALEIIKDRFHPAHWNIYAFHCSDGDNFDSDNDEAMKAARELCETCNLFGYGEIKPMGSHYYESSMLERFRRLDAKNFQSVLIERREDIWPSFRAFMSRERAEP